MTGWIVGFQIVNVNYTFEIERKIRVNKVFRIILDLVLQWVNIDLYLIIDREIVVSVEAIDSL
jgi:hypothetical protein